MFSPSTRPAGKFYIGLMSGTSADGIDLALVEFSATQESRLVASYYQAYSTTIADKITALYQPGHNEIDRAFHLDIELAQLFAQAITALLSQEKLTRSDIIAIGNHGQTIRHRPSTAHPFTLQIGCCQTLATLVGIRVVGQFRRKDMALGGQGAPLVPIFHRQLFSQGTRPVFVVNIGGIANITFLPEQGSAQPVLGFDTGPGNALLDDWFISNNTASAEKFDNEGKWAASGQVDEVLLRHFLQDEYLKLPAPKSTGREYFNLAWLQQQLTAFTASTHVQPSPVDIQATLIAFTAITISHAVTTIAPQGDIYFCGGGVHNTALVTLLKKSFDLAYTVKTLQTLNLDGDILEAMAFAWLAFAFDKQLMSNMPAVTGASASCTLGSSFLP